MEDILWWTRNLKKLLHPDDNWYSGVFEVSDCESLLEIWKFQMAERRMEIITQRFSKSLITNLHPKFRNLI